MRRAPKPITTSPIARAGNTIIGISNLLVRSLFEPALSALSGTGSRAASATTALASRALIAGAIGGGSGHTTAVGAA